MSTPKDGEFERTATQYALANEERRIADDKLKTLHDQTLSTISMWFDLMKHVTTLSSGSILVLASFWDKNGAPKRLVGIVFILLILSLVASLIAMFYAHLSYAWTYLDFKRAPIMKLRILEIVAAASFVAALFLVVVAIIARL